MPNHALHDHPYPVAGLLAVLSVPVHIFLPTQISYAPAAILISMIAGIYVGFAVITDDIKQIAIQLTVALGFICAALLAWVFAPIWIAAVFIAHGFWDAAHHFQLSSTPFPRWYIPFCAFYDVLAGLSLLVIWSW